jgi:hypothetical protein
VTTASGTRVVPEPRAQVWQALAVLEPYCAVCDVSYVVGAGRIGKGVEFVCAPGRLDGAEPPAGSPRGRILEWAPRKVVATRLALTTETWTTRIDLADAEGGGTSVTMTVTLESDGAGRILYGHDRVTGASEVRSGVQDALVYGACTRPHGRDGGCADGRRRFTCSRFSA